MFLCVRSRVLDTCLCVCAPCKKEARDRHRERERERGRQRDRETEWLLGKWLGLGVTCSAMHWWSCETCSNYTLLEKKVDPLSQALKRAHTCVHEGAWLPGRGVMARDVASCKATKLRNCIKASKHQNLSDRWAFVDLQAGAQCICGKCVWAYICVCVV